MSLQFPIERNFVENVTVSLFSIFKFWTPYYSFAFYSFVPFVNRVSSLLCLCRLFITNSQVTDDDARSMSPTETATNSDVAMTIVHALRCYSTRLFFWEDKGVVGQVMHE